MFQTGDIAACYGADFVSRLIRFGTCSLKRPVFGPSHVAIISRVTGDYLPPQDVYSINGPRRSPLRWVESTTLCPSACVIQKKVVTGVQAHHPEVRIEHYLNAGGFVELYRLNDLQSLDSGEETTLLHLLGGFIGEEYDIAGAVLSGTRVFKASRFFPGADLHSLFCSELLAAVLMKLGRMNKANPTRYNPASLIRELIDIGMYSRVEVFA